MRRLIVIPARLDSRRLPNKVLLRVAGQPLLWHVWTRATRTGVPVLVAAARGPLVDQVRSWGAQVVATEPDLPSGSDRVAAAVRDLDVQHVVNVQGDEPLVDPATILRVFEALEQPGVRVSTAAAPIGDDPGPSVVKVVLDRGGDALYFSRSPIPHGGPFLRHLGLYGFHREALLEFVEGPVGELERTESLEQLRLLESGCRIRVVQVPTAPPSVDTEEDLVRVRALLEAT